MRRNPHLRIGRYNQHSEDVLDLDKTPLDFMINRFPDGLVTAEGKKKMELEVYIIPHDTPTRLLDDTNTRLHDNTTIRLHDYTTIPLYHLLPATYYHTTIIPPPVSPSSPPTPSGIRTGARSLASSE